MTKIKVNVKVGKKNKSLPRIRFQKWIYRKDLRANPDVIYLFGDNVERSGFGGQALEMRDEPNALGVITKRRPTMQEKDFFTGEPKDLYHLMNTLTDVAYANACGRQIVIPADGLGTNRAKMKQTAPRLYKLLKLFMKALVESEEKIK